MEENTKINNKTKAIIITVVSIIAVLVLGFGIGIGLGYLLKRNSNIEQTETQNVVNEVEEKNAEEEINQAELEEQQRLEEELAKQQAAEEEARRLEEEAKQQEEAKKQEEAKNKENNKTEEEKKKQQNTAPANNGNPYYIKVNYVANVVTIYGKDANGYYTVPVKAMVCSTGANPSIYNNGTYKTQGKARWGQLIGPVWGQYCTRIFGGVLFHSVPYLKQNDNSTLEYWEYDRLGQARSLGCIRLTVADAKWVYNNCPVGTSVQFYGSSDPGPLGKPSAPKVTAAGDPYRGWDPTDPDPNNPWKRKSQIEAEEEARKKVEAEAKRKAEEEAAKKAAEEEAKRKAEEEAKKKAEEEAAKNKVVVPNVVGKTEKEAKKQLKDLNVTVKYNEKATKDDGLVSHQSITSSSKVEKGTTITITVNKVKKATNTTNTTNSGNSSNTTNTTSTTNTTKP